MEIVKASKKQSRGRIALIGQSGGGKTYSALGIACALGKKVVVIDTERGSASKYSHEFDFHVIELKTFEPDTYIKAINLAEGAGADVIVIDSLSHAWMGKGGSLEQVDKIQRSNPRGNSFSAWRDVTPLHNALIEAILQSSAHVIATLRAKTEYVLEKDERTGKNVPRKIGLAPVQRDGLEYEFDIVGEINQEHFMTIQKTRCSALAGEIIEKPGAELGKKILAWLTDGVAMSPRAIPAATGPAPTVAAADNDPEKTPEPPPVAVALAKIKRAQSPQELDGIRNKAAGYYGLESEDYKTVHAATYARQDYLTRGA